MRTPSRGVIVASSSLLIRPSLSLLVVVNHPSSAPSSSSLHSNNYSTSSTNNIISTLSLTARAAAAAISSTRKMSTSIAAVFPAASSSSSLRVRIVSYNLLSSKLAGPDHFTHTHPDHLRLEYRLPLILSKLEKEMERGFGENDHDTTPQNDSIAGSGTTEDATTTTTTTAAEEPKTNMELPSPTPPPTIFALQEVCYPFASELHTFFASRGYHFVTGLYGRPFNGYMGVGIAYPLKDFETIQVDICRLSDTRPGGWPREEAPPVVLDDDEDDTKSSARRGGTIGSAVQRFVTILIQSITNRVTIQRLGASSSSSSIEQKKPIDPWEMSENRFNVLLTAVLRHRSMGGGGGGNGAFSISNYHMPCAYFAPAVMNIHSEMVATRVQDLAAESWDNLHNATKSDDDNEVVQEGQRKRTIPYILAGDFNILPNSAQYEILTKGMLDSSDPTFPPPKHGVQWKVECSPMNSAYAAYESEPEFTNYAHLKDDPDPFIGTLDYIFLSKNDKGTINEVGGLVAGQGHEWKVHGVRKLPSQVDSGGPFPNEKEPSDHLLISADLELISP